MHAGAIKALSEGLASGQKRGKEVTQTTDKACAGGWVQVGLEASARMQCQAARGTSSDAKGPSGPSRTSACRWPSLLVFCNWDLCPPRVEFHGATQCCPNKITRLG